MSDGSLSQDEIDALLQGTESLEMDTGAETATLSNQEKDAFQNILKEVIESQSSNFSMLIGKTVRIETPVMEVKTVEQFISSIGDEMVEVKIDFTEGIQGEHSYILDIDGAIRIATPMLGQEGIELDEMALSTVGEALSNISGPITTVFGNKINKTIRTSPPLAKKVKKSEISFPASDMVLEIEYPINIEGDMPNKLIEIYSIPVVKNILSMAGGGAQPAGMNMGDLDTGQSQPQPNMMANTNQNAGAQQTFGQPLGGMDFGNTSQNPNVQPIQFANLQANYVPAEQGNIGLLMDVYMEMTVELGRTKKLIKDILTIGEGTIIELDKLAGEPVDILVNHRLIAKGEVVVIDENFGVRVTEIVSPLERMGDLT